MIGNLDIDLLPTQSRYLSMDALTIAAGFIQSGAIAVRDTHFSIDTNRAQGVGFLNSQTKEWTDDSTQEGVDLACGYSVLPHYFALRAQSFSVRG